MKLVSLLSLGLLLSSSAAIAHTPYLVSPQFQVRPGATVTLDAAFAETFFVPEVVFAGPQFTVTGPDGQRRPIDTVQAFKQRSVAEHTLPAQPGTYRFSTGIRHGAVFRSYQLGGKKVSVRDDEHVIPADATDVDIFQALTRAETYVTAGAPDHGALAPHGQGLELQAMTHPSDLYTGEPVRLRVLFDGKPVAGQSVQLSPAVWSSDASTQALTLHADAQGVVQWPAARAGTWLVLARHRAAAPVGAPVPAYSHSYTLTFQVLNP